MKKRLLLAAACLTIMALVVSGCGKSNSKKESLYGQVKSVEGKKITIALAEKNNALQAPNTPTDAAQSGGEKPNGNPPSGSEKPDGNPPSDSEKPDGNLPSGSEKPDGNPPSGNEKPDGNPPSGSEKPDGEPPEGGPQGGGMGMPGLTLTGKEQTVTCDDGTKIQVEDKGQTNDGSLDDIKEGSIVTVTMEGNKVTAITVSNRGPDGGMGSGDEKAPDLKGNTEVKGGEKTLEGNTISSESKDENALLVKDNGMLTLKGATLTKSGDSTNTDNSNFYGLGAVMAVTKGASASLKDCELTSDAEGANAIFATGENAKITANGITIHTKGNSSRGLDATYGGTINASDVNITTEGAHCAPIATDRGEGTITVNGGTVKAAGDGSPCIYSTGNITASNLIGTATGSQAAVVEGKNSITLKKCSLTGAGKNGIMLYQSTSGDAANGTASFSAKDSTLTTTSGGPFFYVTNTDAKATLENTSLVYEGSTLIKVSGNNTNNWGTPGSNGGSFTLTAKNQKLKGNISCDNISTFTLKLKEGSTLSGSIDTKNTGKSVALSLDSDCVWEVTDTSYVTAITDFAADLSNIHSNGNTVYYDAGNKANKWLNGKTVKLPGGGSLRPEK